MIPVCRALKFCALVARGSTGTGLRETLIPGPSPIRVLVGPRGGAEALVLLHGLHSDGARDARLDQLARAAALCGFKVFLPRIEEVADHRLTGAVFGQVGGVLAEILGQQTGGRPLSILAPSYLGSVALEVAAMEPLRTRIKAVCTIGSFCRFEAFLAFVMGDPGASPYARAVLLKNLLIHGGRWTPGLPEFFGHVFGAIREGRADLLEGMDPSALPGEARTLVAQLDPGPGLKDLYDRVQPPMPAFHLPAALGGLQAKVAILHGRSDTVIPCSHALELARHLPPGQMRVLVTPLLTHCDHRIGLRDALALGRLIGFFAFFFRHAFGPGEPEGAFAGEVR